MLDAMRPALAAASDPKVQAARRMAFVYVPNGIHMADWTPEADGADFTFPKILSPLSAFREKTLVLTGMTHDKARPNGDGPGDHARSAASFLTGVQAKKTHGADIRAGVSADQIAAERIGGQTAFPSLELGCDPGLQSGNCDSGYSCAYSANISWRTPSTPMAKETNPRLLFERLFSTGDPAESPQARGRRQHYKQSILDFVQEDTRRLKGRLGARDQRKLDEYLFGVRTIEKRIAFAERIAHTEQPEVAQPAGVPDDYGDHIRLMYDLLAVALEGDLTRIGTYMIANEGSNRSYRLIDVADGHHDLSHHRGDAEKQAKISKINSFHLEQFVYFLSRLDAIEDGDATLLDNTMIVYGSGLSDGNRHNHDDLPVLLVGRGAGTLRSGRHLRYPKNTPMANLYLSMLDRMGVPTETLGDSTGKLEHLSGIDA
jgi:hypothetical protein